MQPGHLLMEVGFVRVGGGSCCPEIAHPAVHSFPAFEKHNGTLIKEFSVAGRPIWRRVGG